MNMDLIAGLPGDTPESFAKTVEAVLALQPEISPSTTLALKRGPVSVRGTPFRRGACGRCDWRARRSRPQGFSAYYLYPPEIHAGSFENVAGQSRGLKISIIIHQWRADGRSGCRRGSSTKLVSPGGGVHRPGAPKYPREYIETH